MFNLRGMDGFFCGLWREIVYVTVSVGVGGGTCLGCHGLIGSCCDLLLVWGYMRLGGVGGKNGV